MFLAALLVSIQILLLFLGVNFASAANAILFLYLHRSFLLLFVGLRHHINGSPEYSQEFRFEKVGFYVGRRR